jgi:hypothetical protein
VPTVANRLANIMVDVEILYHIDVEDEVENNDFTPEDQVFSEDIHEKESEENKNPSNFVQDEVLNEASFFKELDESNAERLAQSSTKQMKNTTEKIKKNPVAPGEFGVFQNWGEDIFLEEKCFPELFPFGDGGYLSSLVNSKKKDIGFAMYVKHRLLSADPKYRKSNTYMFFLLVVKELVQLKRCKQTYMRQATKLPNLSKETLKNVKHENLARYNRSYEVFKTMRGTSMYYEEAKKNVMALLRQNGSPSLFLKKFLVLC